MQRESDGHNHKYENLTYRNSITPVKLPFGQVELEKFQMREREYVKRIQFYMMKKNLFYFFLKNYLIVGFH